MIFSLIVYMTIKFAQARFYRTPLISLHNGISSLKRCREIVDQFVIYRYLLTTNLAKPILFRAREISYCLLCVKTRVSFNPCPFSVFHAPLY